MSKITVATWGIKGLYVIEPKVFKDDRGYFVETYNQNDFKEEGLNMVFVQDNQSMSVKGVLRGLHFQKQFPQGKLVRCIRGKVWDVAADLRADSDTYGKWFGVELSAENKKMFYISEGFAPIAFATCSLAFMIALAELAPKEYMLDAFPYSSVKYGSIASNARFETLVVAALSA